MNEQIQFFEEYSDFHRFLSWWFMHLLPAVPLFLYVFDLHFQAIAATIGILIWFALDSISRKLILTWAVVRSRLIVAIVIYSVTAFLYSSSPQSAAIFFLIGLSISALYFSRRTRDIERIVIKEKPKPAA